MRLRVDGMLRAAHERAVTKNNIIALSNLKAVWVTEGAREGRKAQAPHGPLQSTGLSSLQTWVRERQMVSGRELMRCRKQTEQREINARGETLDEAAGVIEVPPIDPLPAQTAVLQGHV